MSEPNCAYCKKVLSSKIALTKHMATCKEKEKTEHHNELENLRNEYETKLSTLREQVVELTSQVEKYKPSQEPGKRTFTEAQMVSMQDQYEDYVRNLKFTIEVYKKVADRIIDHWDNQKSKYLEQIKLLEYDLKSQKETCELYKDAIYNFGRKDSKKDSKPEDSKPHPPPAPEHINLLPLDA